MRCACGLLGLVQVFGQLLQHLLLEQPFVYRQNSVSRKKWGAVGGRQFAYGWAAKWANSGCLPM